MHTLRMFPTGCLRICRNRGRLVCMDLARTIRRAMAADGRSIYAFARDSGLRVSAVQRFAAGGGLTLDSGSKLCKLLGLELRAKGGRR